jgi:hypothetical protein
MTLFDLILILLVLGTGVAIVVAVIALFFRRWAFVGKLLVGLLVVWIVYMGAGTAVAVLAPQHIMAIGEDRCFDEMCFAVTGVQRAASIESAGAVTKAQGIFFIVNVRIANRSGGRAQREIGRNAVVVDQSGQIYRESQAGLQALSRVDGPLPGLDSKVEAGQSVVTRLVFDIPTSALHPAFALGSDLAFNPARIVIADEDHFLHKPTVVPLD